MNEEVPCHGWKKRGRETNARWRDVGVRVSRSSFSLPIMEKVKKGARLRDFLIPATGHPPRQSDLLPVLRVLEWNALFRRSLRLCESRGIFFNIV